jgi:hypothetical protein
MMISSVARPREDARNMDIYQQNGLLPSTSPQIRTPPKHLPRWIALCAAAWIAIALVKAQPAGPWQQPATALAGQIADILGPGQASLTLENRSSILPANLPVIRSLLVQDLQSRGLSAAGPGSPNSIRITLSESATERVWVAEVAKGNETKVAMVDAGAIRAPQVQPAAGLTLHRERIFTAQAQILASLETQGGLVVLQPERIAIYAREAGGWQQEQHAEIGQTGPLPRDPRGILIPTPGGNGFVAWLAGTRCEGSFLAGTSARYWTMGCHANDDPWIVTSGSSPTSSGLPVTVAPALPARLPNGQTNLTATSAASTPTIKAFYNAARDYFTGVIIPNPQVQLPPFYSAAYLPRSDGAGGLLLGGVDGKLQLLESSGLKTVDGARDWGSDFAALHSRCGTGTQIVASGSGQAVSDSLRAYELPALEAIPASQPLAMNGTVMALWTAPDGQSVMAVVRSAPNQYEVDRVTATCY